MPRQEDLQCGTSGSSRVVAHGVGHEDLMRFTNDRVSSAPIRLLQLGPSSVVIVLPRLSFDQVATPCGRLNCT
jgi:hypothetical protein